MGRFGVGLVRPGWAANAALSEAIQKGEEVVGGPVASCFGIRVEGGSTIEGSLFERGIGVNVGVDGFEFLVTEP